MSLPWKCYSRLGLPFFFLAIKLLGAIWVHSSRPSCKLSLDYIIRSQRLLRTEPPPGLLAHWWAAARRRPRDWLKRRASLHKTYWQTNVQRTERTPCYGSFLPSCAGTQKGRQKVVRTVHTLVGNYWLMILCLCLIPSEQFYIFGNLNINQNVPKFAHTSGLAKKNWDFKVIVRQDKKKWISYRGLMKTSPAVIFELRLWSLGVTLSCKKKIFGSHALTCSGSENAPFAEKMYD